MKESSSFYSSILRKPSGNTHAIDLNLFILLPVKCKGYIASTSLCSSILRKPSGNTPAIDLNLFILLPVRCKCYIASAIFTMLLNSFCLSVFQMP